MRGHRGEDRDGETYRRACSVGNCAVLARREPVPARANECCPRPAVCRHGSTAAPALPASLLGQEPRAARARERRYRRRWTYRIGQAPRPVQGPGGPAADQARLQGAENVMGAESWRRGWELRPIKVHGLVVTTMVLGNLRCMSIQQPWLIKKLITSKRRYTRQRAPSGFGGALDRRRARV